MKKLYLLMVISLVLCTLCACENLGDASREGSALPNSKVVWSDYEVEVRDGMATICYHQYDPEAQVITIPETINANAVTAIGADAFYQHTLTEEIVLPQSLERIEGGCFYRCYSLQKSTIPSNVNQIISNPYFRCSSLEAITVDGENQYFCDIDGVLFDKQATTLIAYPEGKADESYTVPASVTKINGDAFGYQTSIKKLYIFSNVTEFDDYNMFTYPEEITLYVEAGSVAEEYAQKHNLNCELVSEEQ